MTWMTVAQVLVLLTGAGAAHWLMSRDRPEPPDAALSPGERSLVRELEALTEAKRQLLIEHTHAATTQGAASAAVAWQAAERIEQRLGTVRLALDAYRKMRPAITSDR